MREKYTNVRSKETLSPVPFSSVVPFELSSIETKSFELTTFSFLSYPSFRLLLQDGFREGITSGKLSTLQSGFDSGYLLSSLPSRQLGNLRGRASALLALLLLPPPSSTSSSSSPSSTPTTFSRSTTTRSSSTSSSSHLTSHLDPPTRSLLIEDVRSLVRDLGRIKMLDVVGRDLEADEHTKTHGEGGEGGAEWQEGGLKEMDELEGLMEGMSGAVGRAKEKDGLGERGEGGKLDLGVEGVVEGRLRELVRRAVGGKGREEGGMAM